MKKILTKIGDWIKARFIDGYAVLKMNSAAAVKVTQAFKTFVDSPVADLLTALIPGELDDELKYKLRLVLPQVYARIAIAHNIITAESNPTTALQEIKAYIESLGVQARRDWWVLMSANVLEAISDGNLTYSELVRITQDAYDEIYKK